MAKHLKLKGKAVVYIDWANVHGWEKSLKREVDLSKLYKYLKSYKEIKEICFYYGTDRHPKSKAFLKKVKKTGFKLITKPVKHIVIAKVKSRVITKRKCDFDIEICIHVHEALGRDINSFIFFTGDGDFAPLYAKLIKLNKQVIVVYAKRHIGREIWEMKRGLFKIQISNLGLLKNRPRSYGRSLPGRD